jgi:two-component system response regulator HydG
METKPSILIVDDELIVRESLYHWFVKAGHTVETAASGPEALEKLTAFAFQLLFVDIKMPGMSGLALLEKVKAEYPETIVVVITAYGSIESAVAAMKMGASDYLLKPFKPDFLSLVMGKIEQQLRLASEYDYLKNRLEKITRFDNIIGQSPSMEAVFQLIRQVAEQDASVLLVGETGTGKELVAKAIHAKSPRADCPFIAINCGALPESLLESELFGHQRGAFTGATRARKGFLEMVGGGTLFLDEVGEVSLKMQVDLLRVLEEKRITPVGSSQSIPVDFRLITATCQDLKKLIAENRFREDFYYRINVIQVAIPPLRSRRDDIPLLAKHFAAKYSQETTKRIDHITREAMRLLQDHDWPGNVRELQNAIERAVVLSRGRSLDVGDFAFLCSPKSHTPRSGSLAEVEKKHICQILDECQGNITRTAERLGINRVTLHKKIKRLGLQRSQ